MTPGRQRKAASNRMGCWCQAAWWQKVGKAQHRYSAGTQPLAYWGISSTTLLWSTKAMPSPGNVGVMSTDRALPGLSSILLSARSRWPISWSTDRRINHSEVMIQAGEEQHRVSLGWPLGGDIQAAPERLTRSSRRTVNGWGKGSRYKGTETKRPPQQHCSPF